MGSNPATPTISSSFVVFVMADNLSGRLFRYFPLSNAFSSSPALAISWAVALQAVRQFAQWIEQAAILSLAQAISNMLFVFLGCLV